MEEETATNPENVVETQNTTENTETDQETKEEQPEEEQDTNAQDTKEQNEEDQELKEKQEKKREKKRKREVIENLAKSIFGGDSDEEEETEDSLKLDENLLSTNSLSVPDDVSSILGLKKKKKKKKDKERESKKKSKRALAEDSNAEEVDESQEYTAADDIAPPPKEELSDFDAALNRLKKGRARRRKETDEDTTRMDEGVQALIAKMEDAAKNDIEDNLQKKPCLHKLKLLNEVAQQLRK